MAVKLVVDSTSYIPEDIKKQYDISTISLNFIFGDESVREVDIDNSTFYKEMDEKGEIPTSSQPSIDEMYNAFEKIVKEGNDVVAVVISSDMSGTYSSAHLVKNMILEKYENAKIEIVDSRTNCMQMGFVAIEAAKKAEEGATIEEVVERAEFVKNHSKFIFLPDTLTYLKKGGRIGGAAALFGSILQIKPILTVVDGKTTVFDKVRTKKKAVDRLLTQLIEVNKTNGIKEVVVHHINVQEEGQQLADRIEEALGLKARVCSIGPVIGLHVGPGSIGIAYHTEN